jgi:hypothetical protein
MEAYRVGGKWKVNFPALEKMNLTEEHEGDLFSIFLRAGLAFGGGLGILAVLEEELVGKRRAVTREQFLACYSNGCCESR